ncbi:MAG: SufD family Fe-S cluster assembly protein [Oscillospiraceae bacterium]|nr:SufD family Fe-S cluster assembly protein [Oscillospiraceae bacterium]
MAELNEIQRMMLEKVANLKQMPTEGAYNLRLNGKGFVRHSSEHIDIVPKEDKPGIDIYIKEGTHGETVSIPVVVTESGLDDMVYNDFHVADGCDVTIVAGCGIHNCGCDDSKHNGIHTFYIGKNCNVRYQEKHYGAGDGVGGRILNPETVLHIGENSHVFLDMSQIGGVDSTKRYTNCDLADGAELQIQEKLMTHGEQTADSEVDVFLNGFDSRCQITSRSVAKDASTQVFYPRVQGNNQCFGHVQCDSIIMGSAKVRSIPEISANHVDASLVHEAAIGKIAGEQILKLTTLGLTAEEAEQRILEGFLR